MMLQELIVVVSLILGWHVNTISSQTCLTNPPGVTHNPSVDGDVEWTEIEDGVYHTTIVFDVTYYDKEETGWPCTIRIRSHNYTHPSPTLYMYPGNQYQMTFINLLGPESNITVHHNEPRDPNTTNVHTHGGHLSPQAPGDSVAMVANPGTNITYYWELPCNHFSGTLFWHPHYHGSTALHVAYGASGAMIIEQDEDWKYEYYEGQPQWLYEMEELIMVVHWWDYSFRDDRFNTNDDLDYITYFDTNDTECYVETSTTGGGTGGMGGGMSRRRRRRNSRRRRILERNKKEYEIKLSKELAKQQQREEKENELKNKHRSLIESALESELKFEDNEETQDIARIRNALAEINTKLGEYVDNDNKYNHNRRLMQQPPGTDTSDDSDDDPDGTFYTINGEYEPTVCLTAGEWLKMKILWINGEEALNIYLTSDIIANSTMEELNATDYCQMYLVAKDGVLIHFDAPREIIYMFFAPGNRADVLINCVAMDEDDREYWGTDLGSYELYFEDGDGELISTISVVGYDTEREFNVTSYTPNRSDYTPDMRNVSNDTLTVWTDNTTTYELAIAQDGINNVSFEAVDAYSEYLQVNETAEWYVTNYDTLTHPIHIHVIPFQVVDGDITSMDYDVDSNWHKDGDFYDTFWFEGTIRYRPTTFGGVLVYHCHILHHEDEGAMDVSYINGGCDAEWNPLDNTSICIQPSCPSYSDYFSTTTTSIATTTTTSQSPLSNTTTNAQSRAPSSVPSSAPTNAPSSAPSIAPTSGVSTSTTSDSSDVSKSDSNDEAEFDGVMFGIMLVVILIILAVAGFLLFQNNKLKKQVNEQGMANVTSPKSTKI